VRVCGRDFGRRLGVGVIRGERTVCVDLAGGELFWKDGLTMEDTPCLLGLWFWFAGSTYTRHTVDGSALG